MSERNNTIDILKFTGIFLIISAHCSFDNIFNSEFRVFDVVMLMFASAMAFNYSFKKNDSYIDYVFKRFKRLVLSTWIFLIIFFLVFIGIMHYEYDTYAVLTSFLLLSGIGYVWIFRVSFINALICPWIKKLFRANNFINIIIALFCLLFNDIIYFLFASLVGLSVMLDIFSIFITYTIAYGFVSYIGMFWTIMEKKLQYQTLFMLIVTFIFVMIIYPNNLISLYKYPPLSPYILYGCIMTIFMMLIINKLSLNKSNKYIKWISINTFNIYLAHIVVLTILDHNEYGMAIIGMSRFIIVVILSIVLTKIYLLIKEYILKKVAYVKNSKNI